MSYYTEAELTAIVKRSAEVFDTQIDDQGAHEIARRSRGTPRIANRLLKRVRDFSQVSQKETIDKEIVDYALKLLRVDEKGLDDNDRKLLRTMILRYNGRSEEHTSELQSRFDLVCRLLLEQKKQYTEYK